MSPSRAKGPPAATGLTSEERATREGAARKAAYVSLASQRAAGGDWTEERGTSDEGRSRLKGGPEASEENRARVIPLASQRAAASPGLTSEERARREGDA
jgi:hypothetical protein